VTKTNGDAIRRKDLVLMSRQVGKLLPSLLAKP